MTGPVHAMRRVCRSTLKVHGDGADQIAMQRLLGVFDDEALYDIERIPGRGDEPDVELEFSDVAAGPYAALVRGSVDVLATMPGVVGAWHTDREVVLVRAPSVPTAALADAVDRYWLQALPRTSPDPAYGPVCHPDVSRAWNPPPVRAERDGSSAPRPWYAEEIHLAPSRRRMWTYLVCGSLAAAGGATLLATGGGSGAAALGLGVLNLAVGLRIAKQRRTLVA
ncbi:hypothetical protein [Cellulomonas edaphi]|uniref:Uncharacterized protein n=1 Tax=Cellulomonas edaphi TaxID=3053468 RepID=A0ABT7S2Y8_9CELL|nr:hypothetical protein [Cellulomons edaphi]MDM7829899.1 hypothetical protein [Cellulomons edaphi]